MRKIVFVFLCLAYTFNIFSTTDVYTNNWAVQLARSTGSVDRIARKYGFTNLGKVCQSIFSPSNQ